MRNFGLRRTLCHGIASLVCGLTFSLYSGGSGLNVAVIINQSSSNSCELGNYFCERRQVPPENVLRITWTGGNIAWSSNEFQANLLSPLLTMLAVRQLTNQIDYVVLSMDIPYQTINGSAVNSTTSALFYGVKTDSAPDWSGITNSYAASEQIFAKARPASALGYSFLTTMITSDSLAAAKRLVDQGVASDGTFPVQPVILAKSSDPYRNGRYQAFDNAIFNTRLCRSYSMIRTNSDWPSSRINILGYETGLATFSATADMFVPGAMADSLTSFGGQIFGPNEQTSLLAFINAGASGSYGTVTEPSPVPAKFPDPQVYFYQARGFSLAECYYQSIDTPYEGLVVGEPLAAPFQRAASGQWSGTASNSVLRGSAQLSVRFSALDESHPLQQIDLYVDGKYSRALTNLAPLAGNILLLTLNSHALTYTVPVSPTVATVATALAALINSPVNTNLTQVSAFAHGDRVELRSTVNSRPPPPGNLRIPPNSSTGAPPNLPPFVSSLKGAAAQRTTFLNASRNMFLNSQASGIKACSVDGTIQVGTWLQLSAIKTNGVLVSLAVTNQAISGTPLDLSSQLVDLVNSTPGLQGSDGLAAEDLMAGWFGGGSFNLRARGAGLAAAGAQVTLTGSASFVITPAARTALDDNLSDLQPRNHLYVTAGATNLALTFPLDTTTLEDGFHELTAIAFEGSHVRTQTRISWPVRVQNSPLSATLDFLDLPDPSPVQGSYHIQVTANTNNVSVIRLLSTGGVLGSVTNQATATFTINGSMLGVGLHPFFTLVETTAGPKYRSETRWVRLVSGT